jgi:hypothetical protein
VDALELSFPALRGASGAPTIYNSDDMWGNANTQIVGIIVANASEHLLPAQIESVLYENNEAYEEVRFMLPQAVAVNANMPGRFTSG